MSALQIIVTDVGRAEIVNAENTGTAPVVVAQVGLGSGQYVPAANQTALVSEVKRLATISGQVVADDTIHVTVLDEGPDVYDVSEIGLYSASGTLLAVYAQVGEPVMQKVASSSLLLSVDVVVSSLNAASLTLGDTSFSNPPATTTVKGVVELATVSETQTGSDGTRAVTPASLKPALDKKLDKAGGTVSGDISFGAKMEAAANYEPSSWTSLVTKKYADQHGKDAGIGVIAIGWAEDLSLLTAGGHYSYGALTANKPDGHAYGEVIHMAGEGSVSATQIAIEHNSNLISARRKQSGTWQPWYKVATDADLAMKLDKTGGTVSGALNVTGNLTKGGSTVWHASNDGAGSGLDADRLDGLESSQFLRSDQSGTVAGQVSVQDSLEIHPHNTHPGIRFYQDSGAFTGTMYGARDGSYVALHTGTVNGDGTPTGGIKILSGSNEVLIGASELSRNGNKIWDAGTCPANFGVNGYQKLANGLIIQWGTATITNGRVAVTLPITFPNACRCANIIHSGSGGAIGIVDGGSGGMGNSVIHFAITTEFSTIDVANVHLTGYWIAIGY